MKRVKLIYNPVAGMGNFKNRLDDLISHLQEVKAYIVPHRLSGKADVSNAVKDMAFECYDLLMISGGDGTVNMVVNQMFNNNINIPVVIFPSGTSNDFANHLGYSNRMDHIAGIIAGGSLQSIDIGRVNNTYFVNGFAAGLITNVAHEVDTKYKNTLGMLAYYIKGLEKLPQFKPFDIELDIDGKKIKESALVLLVLNTGTAGGFSNLAPKAKMNDGLLDVLVIKACPLQDLLTLLLKIIKVRHVEDSNVLYLQGKRIRIECSHDMDTDMDGEKGPGFPLEIVNEQQKLTLLTGN